MFLEIHISFCEVAASVIKKLKDILGMSTKKIVSSHSRQERAAVFVSVPKQLADPVWGHVHLCDSLLNGLSPRNLRYSAFTFHADTGRKCILKFCVVLAYYCVCGMFVCLCEHKGARACTGTRLTISYLR